MRWLEVHLETVMLLGVPPGEPTSGRRGVHHLRDAVQPACFAAGQIDSVPVKSAAVATVDVLDLELQQEQLADRQVEHRSFHATADRAAEISVVPRCSCRDDRPGGNSSWGRKHNLPPLVRHRGVGCHAHGLRWGARGAWKTCPRLASVEDGTLYCRMVARTNSSAFVDKSDCLRTAGHCAECVETRTLSYSRIAPIP